MLSNRGFYLFVWGFFWKDKCRLWKTEKVVKLKLQFLKPKIHDDVVIVVAAAAATTAAAVVGVVTLLLLRILDKS